MIFDPVLLERWVRAQGPEVNGELEISPIGTGLFNSSYYVFAGEYQWVLRIAPPRDAVFLFYERDMMRQEPEIHRIVQENTSVPVPTVLAYDDSLQILQRDCILMERLPGRPLTEAAPSSYELVMQQIGKYLTQVHRITAKQFGYLGPHRPMEPQNNWVDAFHIMWNKLVDDLVMVGHMQPDEENLLRQTLDRHIHFFDRPVQASLLHMDVWHENILVNENGQVSGLIDWDRGLWGDPEIEFAVLDYCGISTPGFWRGYGQKRCKTNDSQIRNVFYYLYELLKYIVIEGGRKGNARAAERYKKRGIQILMRSLSI